VVTVALVLVGLVVLMPHKALVLSHSMRSGAMNVLFLGL
jgi:hypothetical protein